MAIYFLYGEDTFRSRRKLSEIIERFKSTQDSDVNFRRFVAPDFSVNEFLEATQAIGFFSAKRLVVVEKAMGEGTPELQEKIAENIEQIPEEALVVFWEEGTPKKSPLFPVLAQPGVSEEFATLQGSQLLEWIKSEGQKLGAEIENAAAQKLAELSQADLWWLSTEIEKLANQKIKEKKILFSDVEGTFAHVAQAKIFDLTDALSAKNARRSLLALQALLDLGENEQKIISMLAYQLRNLALVLDLQNRHYTPKQITTLTKLHPFVLRKLSGCLGLFSLGELKNLMTELLELDLAAKSGKIEAVLGLEQFIIKACIKKSPVGI